MEQVLSGSGSMLMWRNNQPEKRKRHNKVYICSSVFLSRPSLSLTRSHLERSLCTSELINHSLTSVCHLIRCCWPRCTVMMRAGVLWLAEKQEAATECIRVRATRDAVKIRRVNTDCHWVTKRREHSEGSRRTGGTDRKQEGRAEINKENKNIYKTVDNIKTSKKATTKMMKETMTDEKTKKKKTDEEDEEEHEER